jgi:CheY-like chemotaxis protein
MNGYQATKMIRGELNNNIPIIAMTAHAMAGEKEKCLQFGMNDYIAKPINANLLFATIYNLTFINMQKKKTTATSLTEPVIIAEKVCNLRYLLDATRGNKEIINNITDVFMEQTPEELSALNDAIEKTDYPVIADIAHKIKSSFSIMGISILQPVFEEIEHLGNIASGIEKIEKLNHRVNAVFLQAMEEMKQEI